MTKRISSASLELVSSETEEDASSNFSLRFENDKLTLTKVSYNSPFWDYEVVAASEAEAIRKMKDFAYDRLKAKLAELEVVTKDYYSVNHELEKLTGQFMVRSLKDAK